MYFDTMYTQFPIKRWVDKSELVITSVVIALTLRKGMASMTRQN